MEIAAPQPDEFNLVFDSWSNSYRKSPWAGTVPNHLWDQVSRATMHGLMERGAIATMLVTPIEGQDGARRVIGYSVSEPAHRILHWLYVKRDYRGLGNGSRLLDATCGDCSGWSYTHKTLASPKFLGSRFHYRPELARIKSING